MESVGDQGGRADLAADVDAVARDQLVAEAADARCEGDRPEMVHVLVVDESTYRLVRRQSAGGRDEQHDDDAGEVLRPAVPVGVAAGGPAPAPPQRQGGRGRGAGGGGGVAGGAREGPPAGDAGGPAPGG